MNAFLAVQAGIVLFPARLAPPAYRASVVVTSSTVGSVIGCLGTAPEVGRVEPDEGDSG